MPFITSDLLQLPTKVFVPMAGGTSPHYDLAQESSHHLLSMSIVMTGFKNAKFSFTRYICAATITHNLSDEHPYNCTISHDSWPQNASHDHHHRSIQTSFLDPSSTNRHSEHWAIIRPFPS